METGDMHVIPKSMLSLVLCILATAGVGASQTPIPQATSSQNGITIERGTEIALVLAEPVSSATAKRGQTVRLKLGAPLMADGRTVLPKGSPVLGKVSSVQRAVPGKRDGRVVITAGSMQLPSGRSVGLDLWMPDRGDCDGAAVGCVLVLSLMVVVESPILAVEAPVLLVKSPKLIHNAIREHRASHSKRMNTADSSLPEGTGVRALTRRTIVLKRSDVAAMGDPVPDGIKQQPDGRALGLPTQ